MQPLNYAILKHFTQIKEACAEDVMHALKDQYGHFKAFNKADVLTSLMTAKANALLEESRFEMTDDNELLVYFHAPAEAAATINRYIRD